MADNKILMSTMLSPGAPPVLIKKADHTSVGRHSHDFYEMVYIRDGFCLHEIEDRMTLLTEGDLFMVKPGQRHRYIGNRVVKIINFIFAADVVPDTLAHLAAFSTEHSEIGPPFHLELGDRKSVMRQLMGMLKELEEKSDSWEVKLYGLFNCLLVDYARMHDERDGSGGQRQAYTGYVMPALEHIDRYYNEDISVKDIASIVGVSSDYLTRQFKQVIGVTPLEYLRRFRFARAMELLQQEMSVGDVADKVGFGSLSHFSREFKKELGITPSKYRNQDN